MANNFMLIPSKGTFDGAELLEGLRLINNAIVNQTEHTAALMTKLDQLATKTRAAEKESKGFLTTTAELNQALELAGKIYGVVSGALGRTTDAIISVTKAQMEAEKIERRAISALSLRGAVTQELIDNLKEFNAQLQQSLGLDADNLLQIQGSLAAMGVRTSKIQEATKATIGLAEVTGKDLDTAVRLVAQAYNGKLTALSKIGIQTKSVADAQARLADFFRLAEAQGDTLERRINTLTLTYGDFEETLGSAFTRSEALNGIVEATSQSVADLINIFGDEEGQLLVDSFFKSMAAGFASLIDAALGLRSILKDTFGSGNETFSGERIVADVKQMFAAPLAPLLNAFAPETFGAVFTEPITEGQEATDRLVESLQRLADNLRKISSGAPGLRPGVKVRGAAGIGGVSESDDELGPMANADAQMGAGMFFGFADASHVEWLQNLISLQEQEQAARREHARIVEEIERDHNTALVEANNQKLLEERSFFDKFFNLSTDQVERQQQLAEIMQNSTEQLANAFMSGVTNMISGAVQALVSGTEDILGSFAKLLGSFMVMMGEAFLAQAATYWALAVPTYGATVPQAIGFTAAGVGLIAFGAWLNSQGGGGGGERVSAGTGSGRGGRVAATGGGRTSGGRPGGGSGSTSPTDGFVSSPGQGNITNIYQVDLGHVIVEGSEAGLGRRLSRLMERADRLSGNRRLS